MSVDKGFYELTEEEAQKVLGEESHFLEKSQSTLDGRGVMRQVITGQKVTTETNLGIFVMPDEKGLRYYASRSRSKDGQPDPGQTSVMRNLSAEQIQRFEDIMAKRQ